MIFAAGQCGGVSGLASGSLSCFNVKSGSLISSMFQRSLQGQDSMNSVLRGQDL